MNASFLLEFKNLKMATRNWRGKTKCSCPRYFYAIWFHCVITWSFWRWLSLLDCWEGSWEGCPCKPFEWSRESQRVYCYLCWALGFCYLLFFIFFGLMCFLQERNVVPSLKKTLNDVSLEKDAAVVAKVSNTCFLLHFVLSCVQWSHCVFCLVCWVGGCSSSTQEHEETVERSRRRTV